MEKKTNQTLITNYFNLIKVYGYNKNTDCWHCLECGKNMGKNNPRQLCGKTYCIEK